MEEKMPLSIILERAKGRFMKAFNEAVSETKLPAYLIESIVVDILCEVRNRKTVELVSEIGNVKDEKEV